MMISYVSFLFWIYDNCPCLYFNKEYDASVYKLKWLYWLLLSYLESLFNQIAALEFRVKRF